MSQDGTPFTITASAGSGGSIEPSGEITVIAGSDQGFSISPDPGYHVADVLVDGIPVGAVESYMFTGVQKDHCIEVTFALDAFDVIASVSGGHGAVDPATQIVGWGGTAVIDLIPDPGYHVVSITDNEVPQPVADPYVINDVTENHLVEVTFAHDLAPTYTWYLAEGCTGGDFDTFLLVQKSRGYPRLP